MFEHDGVRVDRQTDLAQLLHLARTEKRGGIGRLATLHHPRGHVRTRGVHEQRQLVELLFQFIGTDTGELHTHEHDALAKRSVDQRAGNIRQASSHSTSATNCTGPLSVAVPSFSCTRNCPPGLSTSTSLSTSPSR